MTTPPGTPTRVVAGVSFSPASTAGVRWAADHALRRDSRLRLVHACPDDGEVDKARRRLHELAARLEDESPGLDVSARVVVASAVHALVTESHTAAMVVVGGPARGARTVLAAAVGSRAGCPVTAVPVDAAWDHPAPRDRPVAVGIDGGALAERTLQAAFAIAAAAKTGVRVVCCTLGDNNSAGPAVIPNIAEAALAVTETCAAHHPTVPLDVRLARSHAATGLARHALLASMLVIGSSSTATEASTSHRLLRRGPSPVVLVGPFSTATR